MPVSKQFAQFMALLELVEALAGRQTTESLSLRTATGEPVGRLTVEGGQIRFGIEHRGRVFMDEVFMREQPRLSVILRKILDRHSLARIERDLTWDISAIGRVSLCELTARALRKVAADCVLPSAALRPPDTGLPQLRLLNVSFSPMELALAAGLWGAVRHEDPAAQVYWSPPVPTAERWLFEWQPNDLGFAWPILTDNLALRRVADVRTYGSLAHQLAPQSVTRRLRSDRSATSATLTLLDDGVCYMASSSRYLALLIYDRVHIARLLTSLEEFIENDNMRRPDSTGGVLLAGKVALAAGQHAATTMAGLRLSSSSAAASTQSPIPNGQEGAAEPSKPGARLPAMAPRSVPTPPLSSAPPPGAGGAVPAIATTLPNLLSMSTSARAPIAAPQGPVPPPPSRSPQATPPAPPMQPMQPMQSMQPMQPTQPTQIAGIPVNIGTPVSSSTEMQFETMEVRLSDLGINLDEPPTRPSSSAAPVKPQPQTTPPPLAPPKPALITPPPPTPPQPPLLETAAPRYLAPRESSGQDWLLAAAELIDSSAWHSVGLPPLLPPQSSASLRESPTENPSSPPEAAAAPSASTGPTEPAEPAEPAEPTEPAEPAEPAPPLRLADFEAAPPPSAPDSVVVILGPQAERADFPTASATASAETPAPPSELTPLQEPEAAPAAVEPPVMASVAASEAPLHLVAPQWPADEPTPEPLPIPADGPETAIAEPPAPLAEPLSADPRVQAVVRLGFPDLAVLATLPPPSARTADPPAVESSPDGVGALDPGPAFPPSDGHGASQALPGIDQVEPLATHSLPAAAWPEAGEPPERARATADLPPPVSVAAEASDDPPHAEPAASQATPPAPAALPTPPPDDVELATMLDLELDALMHGPREAVLPPLDAETAPSAPTGGAEQALTPKDPQDRSPAATTESPMDEAVKSQEPETARELSETARELPETARELPETARELSETARELSETARELPETVRELPETARDGAATLAAEAAPSEPLAIAPDESIAPTEYRPRVNLAYFETLAGQAEAVAAEPEPLAIPAAPPTTIPPAAQPAAPPPEREPLAEPQAPSSTSTVPLLVLDGFTARIDGRTVLKDISFRLERRGVYAVMGPGGSGKSTLAGILGGQNRASGGWSFEGLCEYNGRPLGRGRRPLSVPQVLHRPSLSLSSYLRSESPQGEALTTAQLEAQLRQARLARLLPELDSEPSRIVPPLSESEWWRLAIARALLAEPELLCVDEPTAGLSEREAAPIIDLLKAEGLRRTVLFVTHNQQHARVISHSTLLIAGGRLQEIDTTEVFFSGPSSRAGQDYVRTGGCYVPSPDALSEHLSEEFQPEATEPPTLALPPEPPPPPSIAPSITSSIAPSPATIAPDVATLWSGSPGGARPVLSLRRFSLRVGARQLLSEVSFDLADRGLYVLAIPDGVSKRMLVRALCGPRPANFHIDGQASYGDGTLGDGNSPATPQSGAQLLMMSVALYIGSALSEQAMSRLEQRTTTQRLLHDAGFPELLDRLDDDMTSVEPAERRVLEILRATVGSPRVLVLEDPLAGLPLGPRERVIAVLHKQARLRSLLLVSQDDQLARELHAPHGWIIDGCTTTQAPPPPEPEPEPEPVAIAPAPPPPAPSAPALYSDRLAEAESAPLTDYAAPEPTRPLGRGPRGFQWLRPGALAGMPAPGMTHDLTYDLDLIRGAGISHLVTLTQETLPVEELRAHSLIGLHFPIVDMDVPSEDAAARLASQIAELLAAGRSVGFHCKAGLGRTGTMLACQLIWEGVPAPQALTQVRSVEPGWIQSDKQVAFLGRFEDWLRRMWPLEQGQRKKRSASPHEHPIPLQGAVMTAKKEKTHDIT